MITGKDKMKVKCYKGALEQSKHNFERIAKDLKLVIDALDKDGINICGEPYWMLAYDHGSCEEMARICGNELEQG